MLFLRWQVVTGIIIIVITVAVHVAPSSLHTSPTHGIRTEGSSVVGTDVIFCLCSIKWCIVDNGTSFSLALGKLSHTIFLWEHYKL